MTMTVQEKVNRLRAEYQTQLDLYPTHEVTVHTFIHDIENTIRAGGNGPADMRSDGKILSRENKDGREVGLHWRELGKPQDGRSEHVQLTPQLREFLNFNPDETDPERENFRP